jgi:methionine biosynthesis protein MetW
MKNGEPMTFFEELSVIDRLIYDVVTPNAKVLDLGCGDGTLLQALTQGKAVKGQGIEISEEAIFKCVERGLSVFHGDIDSGLSEYPDNSFDHVILNQSLPEVKQVDFVLQEALRVGKFAIVTFPNFAHWLARFQLCLDGRTPMVGALPHPWYDTPNLRFLSIRDFEEFCRNQEFRIIGRRFATSEREITLLPNIRASFALFLLSQ